MPPIILRPLDAAFGIKEYKSFGGRYAETMIENKGTSSSSYFGNRLCRIWILRASDKACVSGSDRFVFDFQQNLVRFSASFTESAKTITLILPVLRSGLSYPSPQRGKLVLYPQQRALFEQHTDVTAVVHPRQY